MINKVKKNWLYWVWYGNLIIWMFLNGLKVRENDITIHDVIQLIYEYQNK